MFELHHLCELHHFKLESKNFSSSGYDILFFIISHLFAQNRLPAINYIAEVNHFTSVHSDEIEELKKTQTELHEKVAAILSERLDMMRQIEDMKTVCKLKMNKDSLQQSISDQEMRIN